MKTYDFQSTAESALVDNALVLLERAAGATLTLKAPTGAGKTVMMANALAQLSKAAEGKHHLAILWVAPNKLHVQSFQRLRQVYAETKALACLFADELTGPDIPERTVLFMNWGSIDSETLVLRRDNETRRNLETFIERARLAGRKVVLVVDESHLHLNSGEQAQVVVDHIIKPDLLIEVSATPRHQNADAQVTVLRERVEAAGLIRKRIVVNPGAEPSIDGGNLIPAYTGTSESLLDAALAKQAELTRLYKEAGSPVVPLVLVQLPDRRSSADALERFERHLLMAHGLERSNGVAVWLSEDKSPELDDIASYGSSVRVLFFKQAIATGWDCPRAQILVGLREMQSDTFTTQVLGRIIRQPEHKHYDNDVLNHGYAFTNYEKLKVDAETADWLDRAWVRASGEFSLLLPNWYERHVDRRGHLTLDVVEKIWAAAGLLPVRWTPT